MRTVERGETLAMLARSSIFGSCDENILSLLVEHASVHFAERGTVIAGAGKPFPYVGLVSKGIVSVTVNANTPARSVRRVELYEARDGGVFGAAGFFGSAPPLGDIVAIARRTTYVLIPASTLKRALSMDRRLFWRMTSALATRVRAMAQQLTATKGLPATARVASVLLRFTSDQDGLQPAHAALATITHRDIAAAAACVKESAARAISKLESAGALRREKGHITYLDRGVLSHCAEMTGTGSAL